jgi:hypothetical protein
MGKVFGTLFVLMVVTSGMQKALDNQSGSAVTVH